MKKNNFKKIIKKKINFSNLELDTAISKFFFQKKMRERAAAIIADTLEEYLNEENLFSFKYETDSMISQIKGLSLNTPKATKIEIISDNLGYGKKYFMKRRRHNFKLKILKFKGPSLGFRSKLSNKI